MKNIGLMFSLKYSKKIIWYPQKIPNKLIPKHGFIVDSSIWFHRIKLSFNGSYIQFQYIFFYRNPKKWGFGERKSTTLIYTKVMDCRLRSEYSSSNVFRWRFFFHLVYWVDILIRFDFCEAYFHNTQAHRLIWSKRIPPNNKNKAKIY